MRIALLVPGGVGRDGETQVIPALLWLIERLARRHDVHVFALSQEVEQGDWPLLGAQVHNIGTRRGRGRRLLLRFGKEHRRAPFQVVHAFFGWCGAYAAALRWRYGVPVIFHAAGGEFVALRDIDYGMRGSLVGRLGLRVAVAAADRVTVASEPMQRLAFDSTGTAASIIPLGVALDRWPPSPPRLRTANTSARLLHVGDLRLVKDQETLMCVASALLDRGVDFELDLVGADTLHGATQRSPGAVRLGARCRWHGVLRREPLRQLFLHADLLVVTSRHEAGPLVALEAAVAGVPVLGTAVGHLAEWSPSAAVATPVGDGGALAEAIERLLIDEPRRQRIAIEAQVRALAVDADYTARAFEALYATVSSR